MVSAHPALIVIGPPPGGLCALTPPTLPTDSTRPSMSMTPVVPVVIWMKPPEHEFERMIDPGFMSTLPLVTEIAIAAPVVVFTQGRLPSISVLLSMMKLALPTGG